MKSTATLHELAKETNVPFDYLICMMYELKCDTPSEAFFYNQLDVHVLPMEVITFLLPNNTVAEVEDLFWQVYNRVKEMEEGWISNYDTTMIVWPHAYPLKTPISWLGLQNCWLYRVMSEWIYDETIELKDKRIIKSTLYDVACSK